MKVTAVSRPFHLCTSDGVFTLTSEDCQRLLDYKTTTIIRATAYRVVLIGQHGKDRVVITPATRGGGPAFILEKDAR